MLNSLSQWLTLVGLVSLFFFLGAVIALPYVIKKLPSNVFMEKKTDNQQNRVVHILFLAVRNILGLILLVMGILMLFIPGQGLLTILASLVLMTFPGKRKLIHRLLAIPSLQNGLNRIRRKFGKEEFQFPRG